MGLNITTCYHLFNTLQEAGYVTRNADGGVRLGGRISVLYEGLVRQVISGRELFPLVSDLSEQTQETAYLTRLVDDTVTIQSVVEGSHAVRVTGLRVGFSGSEHVRASGKAVLAYVESPAKSRIIEASTRHLPGRQRTAVAKALDAEFVEIRRQGWAFDDRYYADTVSCVAAPYFEASGDVAGSLAVSVPADRFRQKREMLIDAVTNAADRASEVLGLRSPTSSRIAQHGSLAQGLTGS